MGQRAWVWGVTVAGLIALVPAAAVSADEQEASDPIGDQDDCFTSTPRPDGEPLTDIVHVTVGSTADNQTVVTIGVLGDGVPNLEAALRELASWAFSIFVRNADGSMRLWNDEIHRGVESRGQELDPTTGQPVENATAPTITSTGNTISYVLPNDPSTVTEVSIRSYSNAEFTDGEVDGPENCDQLESIPIAQGALLPLPTTTAAAPTTTAAAAPTTTAATTTAEATTTVAATTTAAATPTTAAPPTTATPSTVEPTSGAPTTTQFVIAPNATVAGDAAGDDDDDGGFPWMLFLIVLAALAAAGAGAATWRRSRPISPADAHAGLLRVQQFLGDHPHGVGKRDYYKKVLHPLQRIERGLGHDPDVNVAIQNEIAALVERASSTQDANWSFSDYMARFFSDYDGESRYSMSPEEMDAAIEQLRRLTGSDPTPE